MQPPTKATFASASKSCHRHCCGTLVINGQVVDSKMMLYVASE